MDSSEQPKATSGSGQHNETQTSRSLTQKPRRLDFRRIHAKPLPVETYPLPTFQPHNPLSLLKVAYSLLSHYLKPPSSHQSIPYSAYFSPETRSVHVTDNDAVRALWEHGFFGKGSLSRSQPNWLDQEMKRRGLVDGKTAEEVTRERRMERLAMKMERARLEQEELHAQLKQELGSGELLKTPAYDSKTDSSPALGLQPNSSLKTDASGALDDSTLDISQRAPNGNVLPATPSGCSLKQASTVKQGRNTSPSKGHENVVENQEHLQLSFEEAFFLLYGLGVLQVREHQTSSPMALKKLFRLFRELSYFPRRAPITLQEDDPFLINYVAYHHFRSLGWVIRPGNKFAVDFLLYKGGPVFAHAEFALLLMPSYDDPYWRGAPERSAYVDKIIKARAWWWLHSINRIQANVFKTLVLVYVHIPPPLDSSTEPNDVDIGKTLARYKIREVVVKRWTPNRSRE